MKSRDLRPMVAVAMVGSFLAAAPAPILAAPAPQEPEVKIALPAAPPATETQAPRPMTKKKASRPDRAVPVGLSVLARKVARHPGIPYLLNEYGNELVRNARLKEAEARYLEAVTLDPEFLIAWHNLGVARFALGEFRKAEKAYKRALEIAPYYAMAHYNLGVAQGARGAYNKALASYQRAIELDPGLLRPENNPQISSNRHLAAILLRAYLDRGGSVLLPVQSVYSDR